MAKEVLQPFNSHDTIETEGLSELSFKFSTPKSTEMRSEIQQT